MIRYNPRGSGQITSQESIYYKQDHIAYSTLVLAIPNLHSYFRMDTTVAATWTLHDASGNAHDMNSAAQSSFTNVAGLLVNDTDGAINTSSATGLVGVGAAATGNGAWSMCGIINRSAFPVATQTFMAHGGNQPAQNVCFSVTSAGKLNVNDINGSQALTGATAMPLNQPVHCACTWDGTNLLIYLNGNLDASSTPAAFNLLNSARNIFQDITGGAGYVGTLDEVFFVSAAMSAGTIKNLFYSMQGR